MDFPSPLMWLMSVWEAAPSGQVRFSLKFWDRRGWGLRKGVLIGASCPGVVDTDAWCYLFIQSWIQSIDIESFPELSAGSYPRDSKMCHTTQVCLWGIQSLASAANRKWSCISLHPYFSLYRIVEIIHVKCLTKELKLSKYSINYNYFENHYYYKFHL